MILSTTTHRPRNVDAKRGAALLYGDLGTSKAYVIGLAFALSGYASFWLIAAVSLLTLLIGINYITVCKYYPNGGGVYASVRHRSQIISMVGAFFIIADYLVTAALSALSAFSYLGVATPAVYSAVFIGLIGCLNYFGPRHTGSMAFVVGLFAFIVLSILIIFSLPHVGEAWRGTESLKGDPLTIWRHFVGVIVALSGIEAIANSTGVMRLDPGSTPERPKVTKTATRSIVTVVLEVAIYTSFFSFIAAAINQFSLSNGTVNAPGNPGVRDYMLKYIGEVFVGNVLGIQVGHVFGVVVGVAMAILLLSAVNTAIGGLLSLQYLMASDKELPSYFQKVNRFGVPLIPLLIATAIPMILVLAVSDMEGLAALYAIGFVGAIATNLGSTSTDFGLDLKKSERALMFFSFLIMAAIEITIFIDKPQARIYGLTVMFIGLLFRGLAKERKEARLKRLQPTAPLPSREIVGIPKAVAESPFSTLCVVKKKKSKALKIALSQSVQNNYPLYVLFIREQRVIVEEDLQKKLGG